jgi:hypothetical protein
MLQDVAELGSMQLGVCRHRDQTGMPDAIEHVEIIHGVLRGDGDPLARLQAKAMPQCRGEPRCASCKLAIIACDPLAHYDRGQIGMAQSAALEPQREIHCANPVLLLGE